MDLPQKCIKITNEAELDNLVYNFLKPTCYFINYYRFENGITLPHFLKAVQIDEGDFVDTYYKAGDIWISKDFFDEYVIISKVGLGVIVNHKDANNYITAYYGQYIALTTLLEKAMTLCNDERVHKIFSWNYGQLDKLAISIYHNLVFYVELCLKVYISLCGETPKYIHGISALCNKADELKTQNNHANTVFDSFLMNFSYQYKNRFSEISGFKEHFIKYDDNESDDTIIKFSDSATLYEQLETVNEIMCGFIEEGGSSIYFTAKKS